MRLREVAARSAARTSRISDGDSGLIEVVSLPLISLMVISAISFIFLKLNLASGVVNFALARMPTQFFLLSAQRYPARTLVIGGGRNISADRCADHAAN